MSIREEIQSKIGAHREKLGRSFKYHEKRVALFQLLRCIDNLTFLKYIYGKAGQQLPEEYSAHTASQLFGWGWNEALSIFWGDHVNQPGIPIFQTKQDMKDWGDGLLHCAGRIRLIELVLELERIQLGKLTPSLHGKNTFDFRFSKNAIGVERIEKLDANYFKVLLGRIQKRDRVWEDLEQRRGAIMAKMETMVEPFEQHYIRFEAATEVDDYYHDLSSALAPTYSGWDAFPQQASFGGLPFVKYIECVRVLMGFALKHLDFCVLLSNRNPAIKPINIVTIPCKWSEVCHSISCALEIPVVESQQLLLMTSITPENAGNHLAVPAGPLASHYMIGKGSAVRLITGCLDNPFHFMLRELRRQFPQDWDRSVDSREHIFRDDLIMLFSHFNNIVFFTDNIDITTDIGKTDIDAFVFDPISKVVGLFQLKWQDTFAGSMRERESRKTNFLHTGNIWVEKVDKWIKSGKMPQTLISSGMPKHIANDISETRIFVIGRNFSHFSGECHTDSRAAWGTWSQLLRLGESPAVGRSPLTILFDLIRADMPITRAKRPEEREEIQITGLNLVIHPFEEPS